MRRVPLRLVPPVDRTDEPGYREWHASVFGYCSVCGEGRQRLERHHVVSEQTVRREGGAVWDLRNSLLLGYECRCHRRHTNAAERIGCSAVSPESIEFAVELLGPGPADLYFDRYYAPDA